MILRFWFLSIIATAFFATTLCGHHSHAATYLTTKQQMIEGRIVQVSIRNPHSFVHVAVPGPDGKEQTWAIEWAAGTQLNRVGVDGKTLRTGDQVTVTGSPSRNPDQSRMLMIVIDRKSDGWSWGRRAGEAVE